MYTDLEWGHPNNIDTVSNRSCRRGEERNAVKPTNGSMDEGTGTVGIIKVTT